MGQHSFSVSKRGGESLNGNKRNATNYHKTTTWSSGFTLRRQNTTAEKQKDSVEELVHLFEDDWLWDLRRNCELATSEVPRKVARYVKINKGCC